ncbi:hypothetical protein SDC9_205379 [bioreactor metagenome]|uniref:Uncharacterized protein n=1 Tax=bioreactor metagenome TaxID=1076179 RepID=A0A645J1X5_9ZZZZ
MGGGLEVGQEHNGNPVLGILHEAQQHLPLFRCQEAVGNLEQELSHGSAKFIPVDQTSQQRMQDLSVQIIRFVASDQFQAQDNLPAVAVFQKMGQDRHGFGSGGFGQVFGCFQKIE